MTAEKTKIVALPIGVAAMGSTRIRCMRMLAYLPDRFDVTYIKPDTDLSEFDILYVQKAAYAPVIDLAANASQRGLRVVYDIDDDFGVFPDMYEGEMCNVASAVTVDCQARADHMQGFTDKPIYVIPGGIDYLDERIDIPPRRKIATVGTYGWAKNVMQAAEFMKHVPKQFSQSYIANKPGLISGATYIPWALDTFIKELSAFDLCILAHEKSGTGNRKGNCRLITVMAVGLPVIVSDTTAFAATIRKLNLDYLVCDDPINIPELVGNLNNIDRRHEIRTAFLDYAWNNYSPKAVGEKLARTFDAVLEG